MWIPKGLKAKKFHIYVVYLVYLHCEIHHKSPYKVLSFDSSEPVGTMYTDKPVRKVIQKCPVWDKLHETICYQQILI